VKLLLDKPKCNFGVGMGSMYRDSFCYHSTLGVVMLLKQKKLIMVVLVLTTSLKNGRNCEHTPQSSWNEGIDSFSVAT